MAENIVIATYQVESEAYHTIHTIGNKRFAKTRHTIDPVLCVFLVPLGEGVRCV